MCHFHHLAIWSDILLKRQRYTPLTCLESVFQEKHVSEVQKRVGAVLKQSLGFRLPNEFLKVNVELVSDPVMKEVAWWLRTCVSCQKNRCFEFVSLQKCVGTDKLAADSFSCVETTVFRRNRTISQCGENDTKLSSQMHISRKKLRFEKTDS